MLCSLVCQKTSVAEVKNVELPSMLYREAQVDSKIYHNEGKVFEIATVEPSNSKLATQLIDNKVNTGWIANLSESDHPSISIIVRQRPDKVKGIYILPGCYSEDKKFDDFSIIKKINVKIIGLRRPKEKVHKGRDEETHELPAKVKEYVFLNDEKIFEILPNWYQGSIDDINDDDESFYATKVKVDILEVEKKEKPTICVSEILIVGKK